MVPCCVQANVVELQNINIWLMSNSDLQYWVSIKSAMPKRIQAVIPTNGSIDMPVDNSKWRLS